MYCLAEFSKDHADFDGLFGNFFMHHADLERMFICFYGLQAGLYLLHDELMAIHIE
jgi:hypothetical protein